MESLVSIIVPVYNTQKYLEQCVTSLLSQTYRNLQIILVDDGSTDGSGNLCDAFATEDGRIQVIHQKNQGVSAARNCGLEKANGEWALFVDSDDILPKDSLASLVKSGADLTMGCLEEFDESGSLVEAPKFIPSQTLSRKQALEMLFDESVWGYQGYLCNKLYRLQVIQNFKIRFDPVIQYNEDRLFVMEYLLHCNNITIIPQTVYFYRQRAESAMGQMKALFKPAMLTELDAFEKMKELVYEEYPNIYRKIASLSFEKALFWLNQIPDRYTVERRRVRITVRKNAKICLKYSKGVFRKVKIIVHCILER